MLGLGLGLGLRLGLGLGLGFRLYFWGLVFEILIRFRALIFGLGVEDFWIWFRG